MANVPPMSAAPMAQLSPTRSPAQPMSRAIGSRPKSPWIAVTVPARPGRAARARERARGQGIAARKAIGSPRAKRHATPGAKSQAG